MSSDDDDEDFAKFGTPLDPLEEDALPRKKAFTIEDQVARDSKGRRRFHGAFTGGFSAGFMNSVGSLEGWKPTEFKSTRSERAGAHQQRPQDYMDEEDMGEFGIAPNRLTAKDDFVDRSNKRKKEIPSFHEGPIPGVPVLEQFLETPRETVGVRLLKAMGWKPGQGVGPRLSAAERAQKKTYGCAPPPGFAANDEEDEDDLQNVTFAPRDVEPYFVNPKTDTFGLGYSGLDRHSVLGTQKVQNSLKFTDSKGKVHIRGQAFGVGAFEDDDEDIYSRDDMSQYDFALGGDNSKKALLSAITAPGVLPGFVQANAKVVKKSFPLPKIPANFTGRHQAKQSRFDPASPSKAAPSKPLGLGRHDINVETRTVLLNELADLPQVTREVPATTSSSAPVLPRSSANTFQPFLQDPAKQKRYEQYLELSDKSQLVSLQPVTLNQWERDREKREFEQASKIFKPLSGVMEDRFTRAQQPDDVNNPLAVVEKVKDGNETKTNAARMKMFGKFTREETDWMPCSLLCKRFNVPEPGTTSRITLEPNRRPKYSIFDSLDALVKTEPPSPPRVPVLPSPDASAVVAVSEPMAVEVEPPAEAEKPADEPLFADPQSKVDLFKSIFLDSSDEEEEEIQPKIFDEPICNAVRNTSPPRGIFANIDLEALSTRGVKPISPATPPTSVITSSSTVNPVLAGSSGSTLDVPKEKKLNCPGTSPPHEELSYGPRLPDQIVVQANRSSDEASSGSAEWEEVTKKSHKSKKSKHKKKSKKKKKKSRR